MRARADVNVLALHVALAAYQHGADWLDELRVYLAANRDFMLDFVRRQRYPACAARYPEATYLVGWIAVVRVWNSHRRSFCNRRAWR